MLTNKFKATVAAAAVVVVAGGITANQFIQQKEIRNLQDQAMVKPAVVQVMVSPTPSATISATVTPASVLKPTPKASITVIPKK